MSGFRIRARDRLERVLRARTRDFTRDELVQPAVVVAPHFDDEVLACGGTVLRKLAVGARVSLVFMTDGGKSHRHLMASSKLAEIRSLEAMSAATVLGVPAAEIVQFGYEEGRLLAMAEEAATRLGAVLRDKNVTQVFSPYRNDDNPDHEATSLVVHRAVREYGRCEIFEYPVWAWHLWPWCPAVVPGRRHLPQIFWSTLRSQSALLRRLSVASDVTDYLADKKRALLEYRSQTSRLIDDPRWLTLQDVGDGEFLRQFFRDREFFSHSTPNQSSR